MCKKNRLTSPVLTYLAISVFLIRFIAEGLCKYPFLFPLSLGGLTVGLIVSLLLIIVDRYGCKNRYCEIMFNILRQFMVMFVVFGTVGLFLYGIVSVHIGFLELSPGEMILNAFNFIWGATIWHSVKKVLF
jgi:membrane protein CcdC involved in cytochrome C biogenesis